jgi:hypothetical protein
LTRNRVYGGSSAVSSIVFLPILAVPPDPLSS